RFERERRILAHMDHPSIARIFDAGMTDDERPWFAMEFVAGVPITKYCDRARCSIRRRIELFVDVCRAVQHAHTKGIIHRDLKPANMLVTEVDDRPIPKVIDFGIAKAVQQEHLARTVFTEVGSIVGTPDYMSPEQADLRVREIDTRTDVYALGVVLYELLCGTLPFDGKVLRDKGYADFVRLLRDQDAPTLVARVAEDASDKAFLRSTTPNALMQGLRRELDWIVQRAMEKDPERRYATVNALAMDLGRYLQGEPVVAAPRSIRYRASMFLHRHRVSSTVTALVFLALVIGIGFSMHLRSVARFNEEQASAALRATAKSLDAQQAALRGYRQMRDVPLAAALVREADEELWPANPSSVGRMDAWLTRARALVSRAQVHRERLESLRAAAGEATNYEARYLFELLTGLTKNIEQLEGGSASGEEGWIAVLEARRGQAATLAERSIGEARALWDAVRSRMAATTRYADVAPIPDQLGLLPLGPDPHSHLEEFALLDTGRVPRRNEGHELEFEPDRCMVFVLLPTGSYWMGAQASDESAPNFDERAYPEEAPVHRERVDAFFCSKFEVTQGQWQRIERSHPSLLRAGSDQNGRIVTLDHPVENVSRIDCERVLTKIGCALPTEAQWEYAARAGAQTPWWTGPEVDSLLGAANIADVTYAQVTPGTEDRELTMTDGFVGHAPCGTFRGNAFGLHDVIGNVWEWCSNPFAPYEEIDEVAQPGSTEPRRYGVYRGGSMGSDATFARSARRYWAVPQIRNRALGCRAIREVVR
ncbi:MAG: SUMF1/EgtB/PvdO family nonheme iron enzyme, partial [Planctomycetes bacterium]|nr:SUMF1/EgtB/PvdO family nonheme iron enzyme [Planctomycetota bacterium]